MQDNGKGVVLRWLEDQGKVQVQLEDGRLAVADPQNVIREATRGAEGRESELQRKDKMIKKRTLKEISRIKRAGAHWKNRMPLQETLGTRNKKQKASRQIRTAARVSC